MSKSFLSYQLPAERIAQYSLGREGARSASRLLYAVPSPVLQIQDHFFYELPSLLRSGDLLVLNNSAVVPCRFFATLADSETPLEVFLLRTFVGPELEASEVGFEALAKPMKRAKEGKEIRLSPRLIGRVLGRTVAGDELRIAVRCVDGSEVRAAVVADAMVPIPGYIRGGSADEQDRRDYQTVYAETPGSVAAPTAGFHFTPELLQELKAREIETATVTLHVGQASFQPVQDPEHHDMRSESYSISKHTAEQISKTRQQGGRIVAVGTTTLRSLESAALAERFDTGGEFRSTKLFIRPGFRFQVADLLITNFHQPMTTHLLLVAAFIGEEAVEKVYQHALSGQYRFLSYGDACLFERVQSDAGRT